LKNFRLNFNKGLDGRKYIAPKESVIVIIKDKKIIFLYCRYTSNSRPKNGFVRRNVKGKIPVIIPMTRDDIPRSLPISGNWGSIGPRAK
jgi:hypothetical protein